MEISFTTMIIANNKIMANKINVEVAAEVYMWEIYSSGCIIIGDIWGINIIIDKIKGIDKIIIILMIIDGIGRLGEMATKYENRTNIPLT